MAHLSTEDLIDRLDAAADAAPDGHLASCETCRARLAEMRATMAALVDIEVPDPPAHFWSHFSDRVRDTVERDGQAARGWRWLAPGASWWAWPLGAGAVAALALAVALQSGQGGRAGQDGQSGQVEVPVADAVAPADDAQMALVVDLATGLDWDDFSEAGLSPRIGGVDGSLDQLNEGERIELERLLAEALGRAGA